MKRRFEFVEGASSKFWEVEVDGTDVTVTYGRIGTTGQARIKTHASPAAATQDADKLIGQKTGKGYVEAGSSASAATKKAPAKKAATEKAPAKKAATKKAPAKKAATKKAATKKGPALRPVDRTPTAVGLLDGRTLVISSEDDVNKCQGYDANVAFVFDPEEVAFTLVAETPFKMYLNAIGAGCTAAGQAVFVKVDEKNQVACFDPASGTWRAGKPFEALHNYAAAALLDDGRVVVAGGETYYPGSNDAVHLYDVAKDTWSKVGKLSQERSHPTALRLNDGAVLILGGEAKKPKGDYPTEITACDRFDPKTKKCTAIAPLPKPLSQPSALLLADGRVAVAGQDDICALYDPAKDKWSKAIAGAGLCKPFVQLADGKLAFFAGQRVTVLDPTTGKLQEGGETLLPRNISSVAIHLPDDRVLLIGGDLYNNIASEPELWDPKTKAGAALDGLEGKVSAQLRRLAKYREKNG